MYALAVLVSLLTFGSLSDFVGRRPVLLNGHRAPDQVVMVLFTTAGGVTTLMVARIIQGLSTGAAVGAIGAGLLDLDRARGTVANSVAPMLGTATGGILSGAMVEFLPAPTPPRLHVLIWGVHPARRRRRIDVGDWRRRERAR